jgi:hypothetical protein
VRGINFNSILKGIVGERERECVRRSTKKFSSHREKIEEEKEENGFRTNDARAWFSNQSDFQG